MKRSRSRKLSEMEDIPDIENHGRCRHDGAEPEDDEAYDDEEIMIDNEEDDDDYEDAEED